MNDGIVSEEKNKPVLDEQTLAKLLEAAYVLQEHNRELQQLDLGFELKRDKLEAQDRLADSSARRASFEAGAQADYTSTLAQIVEIQHRIQVRHLDLQSAISLVAERVVEIGHGAGAAIGTLKGETVQYPAVAGRRTLPAGSTVPLEKALCVSSIRTGQVFRCVDVDPEVLLDSEECHRRGIQSLITVPVFHEGATVGGLELYYSEPHGFTEQDVHTCQLMAGLVTEAFARDEELSWKKSLASERAVMMQALEKLKPSLTSLVNTPGLASTHRCNKCGHNLVADEQFCGQCGTPRPSEAAKSQLTTEVKSVQQAGEDSAEVAGNAQALGNKHQDWDQIPSGMSLDEMIESLKEPMTLGEEEPEGEATDRSPELPAELLHAELGEEELQDPGEEAKNVDEDSESEEVALAKPVATANWSSALSARDYLEQLAGSNRSSGLRGFWNSRRGDIYLAVAVLLVACVIRWGIWSNHPVSATGVPNAASAARRKADADRPLFDRILLSLGLAETPEQAEDNGNPATQVWVDLHTALYYCPGADLYGKTASGKYTTQRDAQLDQFQPAYRKVCK